MGIKFVSTDDSVEQLVSERAFNLGQRLGVLGAPLAEIVLLGFTTYWQHCDDNYERLDVALGDLEELVSIYESRATTDADAGSALFVELAGLRERCAKLEAPLGHLYRGEWETNVERDALVDEAYRLAMGTYPAKVCECGTVSGPHAFGVHPDCEHFNHHCDSCHERGVCTAHDAINASANKEEE